MAPKAPTEPFINLDQANEIAKLAGTPTYVYSEAEIDARAQDVLGISSHAGHRVRYAMKASPTAAILRTMHERGIHIDASSEHEAQRAMLAGIPAQNILLTTQEFPRDLDRLVKAGVHFNACSLAQLSSFGEANPGSKVSVRINPGEGSGAFNHVNVGGRLSSFGIWHELIPQAQEIARNHGLTVERIHTHIGSGTDPEVWSRVAGISASLLDHFPDAHTLNLGGGFKVARMPGEKTADLREISEGVARRLEEYERRTGRKIFLEIEPGTYLMANAGAVLTRVTDVVSTGQGGNDFIKLDTGMTELLRPSLYGAQHPMWVLPQNSRHGAELDYMVVGHCCESGDIMTVEPGQGGVPSSRRLTQTHSGDFFVIGGAGAYASSMSTASYNSFPQAPEVMIREDGRVELIRKRQNLDQIIENEV